MKKIIFLAMLLMSSLIHAQVRFIDKEYFISSISIDPLASVKESSPNIVLELGLVSYWKYINVNIQILSELKGGYMDFGGTFGINLTTGRFDNIRYYSGLRLGQIKRGLSEEKVYTYPLVGGEAGIDIKLSETYYVGVKGTGDYRTDFKYSGANPEIRYSGFVKLGIKF